MHGCPYVASHPTCFFQILKSVAWVYM